jgi:hypothetical protein
MHKVFVLFVQVNSVKEANAKDHAVTTAYTKISLELRRRTLKDRRAQVHMHSPGPELVHSPLMLIAHKMMENEYRHTKVK